MFRPPVPFVPNSLPWHEQRTHNPQWRPNYGARAQGYRPRFNQFRPQFQEGNDNFWCETCDRGFPTEDILNKHKQQHQKCNIDGCQFIAHPKVITKHIQMQHSSGLYKKIANIHKPEDIEKWREERKTRYPTKANIDKKAAILKEKIERGEKMGMERRQFNKDKTQQQGQGVKRRHNMSNENHPRSKFIRTNPTITNPTKKPPRKIPSNSMPLVEDNRKLKQFSGISSLDMDSDVEIEEPKELNDLIEDHICDDPINEDPIEANSNPIVCGALSSLMCDYGSSDEEDEEKSNTVSVGDKNDLKLKQNETSKSSQVNENNTTQQLKEPCCDSKKDISVDSNLDEKEIRTNADKTLAQENVIDNSMPTQESKVSGDQNIILNKNSSTLEKEAIQEPSITETDISASDKQTVSSANPNIAVENVNIDNSVSRIANTDLNDQENDDDSGPEEVKVVKSTDETNEPPVESPTTKETVRTKTVVERRIFHRPPPKLPSTLLHKLLFREMQQERNIVLQCIRYIRKNEYFDNKK